MRPFRFSFWKLIITASFLNSDVETSRLRPNDDNWALSNSMNGKELDGLDRKLIHVLTQDGRMSAGSVAQFLGVTPPTVRARLDGLVRSGVLRIAALLNLSQTAKLNTVIVGISLEIHKQLDKKLEQISNLPQVHWAAAVTGRFDIIVEVILQNGIPGLYRFLTADLPRIGGIRSSESFVVMSARKKWILFEESDHKTKKEV